MSQVFTPGTLDDQILSVLDSKNKRYQSRVYNYSIRYDLDSMKWNPWKEDYMQDSRFLSPVIGSFYNSSYARGYNDGPLWKGKGLTTEVHAGMKGKIGKKFHYTFQPVFFFSQNSSFPLINDSTDGVNNKYTYQLGRIDFVQRYGNKPFIMAKWGQSELRYLGEWVTAAISTQNFSFGASEMNPILMSKNAPGIPHLHIGTSRPINIRIKNLDLGEVETHIHYGILTESDYLDSLSNNNYRYFNGLTLGYTPPFLNEFTFGFSKMLYKSFRYFDPQDLYSIISVADDGIVEIDGQIRDYQNDSFDQLASLFVQFHDSDYGIKVYIEYAKNDFNGVEQTFTEPQHARALGVGFEKLFEFGREKILRLKYEHSNLIRSSSSFYRVSPRFYIHNANIHGYTNEGQLLGAGTGPGSHTDYLSLDWIYKTNIHSVFVQRIGLDEDYFLQHVRNKARHDAEYTLGYRLNKTYSKLMVSAQLLGSLRLNRYYVDNDNLFNIGLGVSVRYKL